MTGARRLGNGVRWRHARQPQGYVPVTVVATERHTPTVVITAVTPEPPAQTEVITDSLESAEHGVTENLDRGAYERWAEEYTRGPVPDLGSPDPADRTEWFAANSGDETLFAQVLNDHPDWLYLIGLPIPPRKSGTESKEVADGSGLSGTTDPVPAAEDEAEGAAAAAPEPADAAGTGTDPSPEAFPPPAGAPSAPGTSGLVTDTGSGAVPPSGEDRDQTSSDAPEPVQDEPVAEHDCAEGTDA